MLDWLHVNTTQGESVWVVLGPHTNNTPARNYTKMVKCPVGGVKPLNDRRVLPQPVVKNRVATTVMKAAVTRAIAFTAAVDEA
jgi:hypothetical protein